MMLISFTQFSFVVVMEMDMLPFHDSQDHFLFRMLEGSSDAFTASSLQESLPGIIDEAYSPNSSSDSFTQLGPVSQFSSKDNLSFFNDPRGSDIKQRLHRIVSDQRQCTNEKMSELILGLPVLYYPDIEIVRQDLLQRVPIGNLQRSRFGYRAACCIGFISEQTQLDRNVLAFVKECESFQRNCVPICEAITAKRMEIYAFVEAVDLFRSRLIQWCLAIQKLHKVAQEWNFREFGFLKNTSFVKECRMVKQNLKSVENTKLELYSILSEIHKDLTSVDQSTNRAIEIENQWTSIQRMFEAIHDKYGDQEYLMEAYTFPLWHYFDQAGTILDTDSRKIFMEYAQAQKHLKKDISRAEELLLLAAEHIMWSQLALLKIENCATKYVGRLTGSDIPHLAV